MDGLLAWERLPWLLGPWVERMTVEDWSAGGWRGRVLLRDYGETRIALALHRQQSRAAIELDGLAEAELRWSRLPPSQSAASAGNASSTRLVSRVSAVERCLLRGMSWALRRVLWVAALRERQLGRRIDGAGFPSARCRRCLGPLQSESHRSKRQCGWCGRIWPSWELGLDSNGEKERGVPEGREGRGDRALL